MNRFFDLVGFEYKKMFKRKSAIINLLVILILVIILSITTITGAHYWHSEGGTPLLTAMKLDRETVRSKAGPIDENYIKEAIEQYTMMRADDNNYLINDYGRFIKSDAYIQYVLPYEKVLDMINTVYETNMENLATDGYRTMNTGSVKPVDNLTAEAAESFYEKVREASEKYINGLPYLSQKEKDKHMQMLSQVKTPFYNDYYEAYLRFAMGLQVIALILFVTIINCVSPIFSSEYQGKTDQILLSSKYGKDKVIFAKLFTAATFSVIVSIATLFIFLILLLLLHGPSGFNMTLQTIGINSTYPLTVLQATFIAIAVTVFMALFFAIMVTVFSAWCKTPFSVVIVSFLVLLGPGLLNVSPKNRLLYQLIQLLPVKATEFPNIFSKYLFIVWGKVFTPATMYILFSIIGSLTMIPISYRVFKNHQIG